MVLPDHSSDPYTTRGRALSKHYIFGPVTYSSPFSSFRIFEDHHSVHYHQGQMPHSGTATMVNMHAHMSFLIEAWLLFGRCRDVAGHHPGLYRMPNAMTHAVRPMSRGIICMAIGQQASVDGHLYDRRANISCTLPWWFYGGNEWCSVSSNRRGNIREHSQHTQWWITYIHISTRSRSFYTSDADGREMERWMREFSSHTSRAFQMTSPAASLAAAIGTLALCRSMKGVSYIQRFVLV